MTAQVTEASPGLEWLRGVMKETQRQITSLRMRVAALEEDVKIRDRREADFREELRVANEQLAESESQLDESSATMKAAVRQDVDSDIEQLSARDRAIATVLVVLAAKVMAAGQESMQRLGLPDDVVRTVRGLVFGFTGDSVPPVSFTDGGNGMRYSAPPVTAQVSPPPARNSVTFLNPGMSAEERELREYRAEMITRTDNPNGIHPRRATDRMLYKVPPVLTR